MNDIITHFGEVKEHPNCEKCGKEFTFWGRWCGKCDGCGIYACSSCMKEMKDDSKLFLVPVFIEGDFCESCFKEKVQPNVDKIEYAKYNQDKVEIYSENYRGKVAIPGTEKGRITTGYYRDRGDAEVILKRTAAFLECDIVFDTRMRRKTGSEDSDNGNGTYRFSLWSLSGIPAKSNKRK